jgi:basic membrane protein A
MKTKRILAAAIALTLLIGATACGSQKNENKTFSVGMVTDVGGVNDQSFNQSAWRGLQQLQQNVGADVSYLESKQESDYSTNLDRFTDKGSNVVWGIGFAMAEAIKSVAQKNPDINYGIIDNAYDNTPSNVTGVIFRAQEAAFEVGYIAALKTQTNKVGFVGGQTSNIIDQFQYGFQAGVAYGAKELNKDVSVSVQYTDSFTDSAKGKATANKMYVDGCDIVFHAAGGCGTGVIEAAKDNNKFVIGVDSDQSYLAPNNVITSALKRVDNIIEKVTAMKINGEEIGGKNMTFGLSENGVGIPEEHKLIGDEIYNKAKAVEKKIADGVITPPSSKETFSAFNASEGH